LLSTLRFLLASELLHKIYVLIPLASGDARRIQTLVMHMHTDRAVWEITLDLTEYGTGTTCATKLF
jgi:hypothetical protein